jgi:hypothetical protein
MMVARFRRGDTRFCRVLCDAMEKRGMNPSRLHRELVKRGYPISLDSVYKYCAGVRTPTADFMVAAGRCIAESPDDEEALAESMLHAHTGDLATGFAAEFSEARQRALSIS